MRRSWVLERSSDICRAWTGQGSSVAIYASQSELVPVRFLHLDVEVASGLLNVGKRYVLFLGSDALHLIEPRHRVANMRCISHRLFACARKGEGTGRQRVFGSRGKAAMRCHVMSFPGGVGHPFNFQCRRNSLSGRHPSVDLVS